MCLSFVCMYMCTYVCVCECVPVDVHSNATQSHNTLLMSVHKFTQDFVVACMMGTHARLGAYSPVLLLDPHLAVSIAQIIIADRW